MPISGQIHRILYIRTDRIGDVLMNLPAIRVLRQTFPKAWISVMMDESIAELLRGHPDIDEVITVSAVEFKKSFRYRASFTEKIKKIKFDLGIAANPDKYLHALLYFSKIRHRLGYDRKWSFFLDQKAPHGKSEPPRHESRKNLDLIRLVSDKEWDSSISLPADEFARKDIEAFLKKDGLSGISFIAVHSGTSDPKKRWAEGRFAEVCDRLQVEGRFKVILVGGKEEVESSKKVSQAMKTPVLDWTGRLDLRQLTALFHHPDAKLLLSSDSGPVHIAWISGTKVVAFYAKDTAGSDPQRWGPLDGKSEVIFKPMPEVTADEVFYLAKKVLEKK